MTHFGLICPASTGHLNTILPLGQALQQRGHRVTLISIPDLESKAIAAGIEFYPVGKAEYTPGAMAGFLNELGKLNRSAAIRYTFSLFQLRATVLLRDVPHAVRVRSIEALIVDQFVLEGGTIAEFLGIPFITLCSGLLLHQEPSIPPPHTPWNYQVSTWAKLRNQIGYARLNSLMYPLRSVILTYRQKWQLPLYQNLNDYYSPLAQISQEPAEFEFPRRNLPAYFHFVGPYHSATPREPIAFPYDRLTGQPLVYASLGTIMGRLSYIFESIAQACQTLKVQLVISLGGSIETDTLFSLPGNPIVVAYAPQLELLKRANLTITHAGLNTTLESLTDGVPMIAIPVANDGPGVATRIRWTGTGKVLNPSFLTVQDLRHAIQTVLSEPSYRQNALGLKAAIVRSGGLIQAVKIIESAIKT